MSNKDLQIEKKKINFSLNYINRLYKLMDEKLELIEKIDEYKKEITCLKNGHNLTHENKLLKEKIIRLTNQNKNLQKKLYISIFMFNLLLGIRLAYKYAT